MRKRRPKSNLSSAKKFLFRIKSLVWRRKPLIFILDFKSYNYTPTMSSVHNATEHSYVKEQSKGCSFAISMVQYASDDLYCSTFIELPKNNTFTMDEDMVSIVDRNSGKKLGDLYDYVNNDNNIGYSIAGVSEAADLGIPEDVDLSGVDEDHAVLVYQLPNVRINGQEIYRDLMKDMQKNLRQVENQTNLKLEYGGRLQTTICVDGFPSVDRFLYHGDHDMTMAEYYNRVPFLQTTLLLSDTRYEAYERAMDE